MRGRVRHARRGRSTNTVMSWEVASSQHSVSFFMRRLSGLPHVCGPDFFLFFLFFQRCNKSCTRAARSRRSVSVHVELARLPRLQPSHDSQCRGSSGPQQSRSLKHRTSNTQRKHKVTLVLVWLHAASRASAATSAHFLTPPLVGLFCRKESNVGTNRAKVFLVLLENTDNL